MKPLLLGLDAKGTRVKLTPAARRTHLHVIGSSGSGKSKFLEHLIRQDIRNGQGFCLIDPHGSLYEEVFAYCAHSVAPREIVLLNLSQPSHVVGFNPFRKSAAADVSVQVDNRIVATMHAWGAPNSDATPTLERTLRLVYTMLIEQELPFQRAEELIDFHAKDIREPLIRNVQSTLIRKEWEELQQLRARDWRAEVLSAKNRLFRLLTSTALARFFSPSANAIDVEDIVNNGKVLLVNLAASDQLSSENARVFGALLVNEFFEVAKRRDTSRTLKPFYLYLDEFQRFVSLDVTAMLDEIRKFGLYCVLAHQRFGHLDENLIDAVLTNCRIKAVFGGLPVQSAQIMAEELFVGKLNPRKIKAAIYQTKFWPQYARDTIRTRSKSLGHSVGRGENYGTASMSGSATGEFFMPGDWFSGGGATGTSTTESSMTTTVQASHSSETDFWGETEGEADVPIFIPVPFKELSSVQYFSLEEQLTQLTAALKEQYPRHCFIKIQSQETQPMLVPLIRREFTSLRNRRWYEEKVLARIRARQATEIDRELKRVQESPKAPSVPGGRKGAEIAVRKSKTHWEDLIGRE